MNRYPIGAVD